MKEFFTNYIGTAASAIAEKIIFAIILFIVGHLFIRFLFKALPKSKLFLKLETSAKSFILSTAKLLLYALLIVMVITVLGVPTTSIIAVFTSAFLAIGLALQGALSNFAGGIMILLFKPFKAGDYITCSGGVGTVSEISVFYTSIITDEKNRITVPNGTLMNDSVINHTAEEQRRVDIKFSVAYDTNLQELSNVLCSFALEDPNADKTPAHVLQVVSYTDTGITCSFRVWCKAQVYWDLYFSLMTKTDIALKKMGSPSPASKLVCNIKEK